MSRSFNYGLASAALALGLGMAACAPDANDPGVQYAPEMYESIPFEPLRQISFNQVNPMGLNERDPAIGTIPRGKLAYFDHIPKDSVGIAERRLQNPYPYTLANLQEGQVLFGRYCQHCHGEGGKGDGPVAAKFKGVPNYATGAYKNMNDGHIYHVIEWGKGRMMPHGSQVNPEERWKIAMYIHVLQQNNDPGDLPKLVRVGGTAGAVDTTKTSNTALKEGATAATEAGTGKGSDTPGQGNTKGRNGSM